MMKKGCILLNVSRGGLVDSDEVMSGLESGQIGALGMDVWENEGERLLSKPLLLSQLPCSCYVQC